MIKDKLKKIMKEKEINQSQLSEMTGISVASMSQYMTGKNNPTHERRMMIAEALGLDPEYFENEHNQDEIIKTLPVEDAARLMGIGVEAVKAGLRERLFSWGYAIKTGPESFRYWINEKKFRQCEMLP